MRRIGAKKERDVPLRSKVAALAVAAVAAGGFAGRDRVLPDVLEHLSLAESGAAHGRFNAALAHAQMVLLQDVVRYRIAFDDGSAPREAECREALNRAFDLWRSALQWEVDFQEAGPGHQAELTVTFQQANPSRNRMSAGHIEWRRTVVLHGDRFETKFEADIRIRTVRPGGRPMTVDQIAHAASHELGHVFGLKDSRKIGEIMGPLDLRRPARRLAARETEAIFELRRRARQIRGESLLAGLWGLEGYNRLRAAD